MSEFVLSMRSSVSSAASAYIQFANDYIRGEYTTFVFVEDWPDIVAYQHILELDGASFLGCGGKDGVLQVYGKLVDEGKAAGQCFIVDRDIEEGPQLDPAEVLRTQPYSWENHLVEAPATLRIAQRRSQPNLSMLEAQGLVQAWRDTLAAFGGLFALHGALLRVRYPRGLDLNLHAFPVTQGSTLEGGVLTPGGEAREWMDSKVREFVAAGGLQIDVDRISEALSDRDILSWARGKTIFAVWRRFMSLHFGHLGRRFLGEISSSSVVVMLPSNNNSWTYIQDDVRVRIAA